MKNQGQLSRFKLYFTGLGLTALIGFSWIYFTSNNAPKILNQNEIEYQKVQACLKPINQAIKLTQIQLAQRNLF